MSLSCKRTTNALSGLLWTGLRMTLCMALVVALTPIFVEGKATPQDKPPATTTTSGAGTQSPEPPKKPAEPSLMKIDEFKLQIDGSLLGLRPLDTRPITEIVNPFRVRKRGRSFGSLYEYHRNDNFDARNFFDPVGRRLPEYKRNQFGVSFGTFVTDRLTVFGTYDGLRIHKGSTIVSHIPTPEMKVGDFGGLPYAIVDPLTGEPFPENRIPSSRIHPVAAGMLGTIPDPNRDDPDRNFVNNQPYVENVDTITARIDYEFSEESKFFGNYTLRDGTEIEVNALPLFGLTDRFREQGVELEYTRTFSTDLVGSIRMGFEREVSQELSDQSGQHGLLASLGIAGVSVLDDLDEGYPQFEISGYADLGTDGDLPSTSFRNEYSLEWGMTWVRRAHKLQFGADIGVNQLNNARETGLRRGQFEFDGDYTGNAFADFLLGIPTVAHRAVGSDRADLRRTRWKVYLRDDWKISPRFDLSVSLAYTYAPFFHSIHNNVSTFAPLLFDPPGDGQLVVTGSAAAARAGLSGLKPGRAVYPDRNDWEPHIGVAYSPLGNNRLVVRASYQLNYDSFGLWHGRRIIGRNYPFYFTESAESHEERPDLDLADPFRSVTPAELNIWAAEPRLSTPHVQEWRLTVENEFLKNWNLEMTYEGRKATHSERTIPANVPLPGPGQIQGRRPNVMFGRFDILTGGGSSTAHELYVDLRKRFSRGYSVAAEYSWRRAFGDDARGDPSNPRDLRAERARGERGPEHGVTINYILDLPLGPGQSLSTEWAGPMQWLFEGWRLSGITEFESGGFFTPRMPGDPNNDGLRNDRPDRIAPGNLSPADRSIDGWFDTAAFVSPPAYRFGNSGRNILIGPGTRRWDISLIKRTRVTDTGHMLEFRVQLFNAFNHANFRDPDRTFGTTVFGKIFGADHSREIEIALKYSF